MLSSTHSVCLQDAFSIELKQDEGNKHITNQALVSKSYSARLSFALYGAPGQRSMQYRALLR